MNMYSRGRSWTLEPWRWIRQKKRRRPLSMCYCRMSCCTASGKQQPHLCFHRSCWGIWTAQPEQVSLNTSNLWGHGKTILCWMPCVTSAKLFPLPSMEMELNSIEMMNFFVGPGHLHLVSKGSSKTPCSLSTLSASYRNDACESDQNLGWALNEYFLCTLNNFSFTQWENFKRNSNQSFWFLV